MQATARVAGDVDAFVRDAWATRMHLHHGDPDDLAALLTVDDVDHLLAETALRTPQLRVIRDGMVLPARSWTRRASIGGQPLTGLVDVRRVLDLVDSGATLVLQGLQRYWPPLTRLLAELEHELGHPCQANAYLTPPVSQGFDWHADAHDVFVVQTHGTKQWGVRTIDHLDRASETSAEASAVGEVEVELVPGSCLYLPAGTDHAARALDTTSLHVTIGVQPLTWRHAVEREVRAVLDHADLDHPLPAGWLADPAGHAPTAKAHLDRVLDGLASRDPVDLLDREADRFRTGRDPAHTGGLADRLLRDALADETVLVRRPGHRAVLRHDGDHVRLLLGDREVRIPAWVTPALEEVVARDRLTPADLAEWLSPDSRLVLLRRLVREGLLRIVA